MKSDMISSNDESNQKRIWRFLNNKNIDIYQIYKDIISYVIKNVSNVKHNELIVTLDHMFTKNNFVTLMFTLKIDKQGIPLFFRTERTLSNCHLEIQKYSRKKLFTEKYIIDCIDEVINLLSPLNTKITFLADRWFFNLNLLKHIDESGHYYCFRAKANSSTKVYLYNKKEKHKIYMKINELKKMVYHSVYYENVEIGDMYLKANISISSYIAFKERNNNKEKEDEEIENWYIISNIKPKITLNKYSKRFGLIEMFFKSQKTNGFYLEETKAKNLHAFETLYGIICLASLWLNILGVD